MTNSVDRPFHKFRYRTLKHYASIWSSLEWERERERERANELRWWDDRVMPLLVMDHWCSHWKDSSYSQCTIFTIFKHHYWSDLSEEMILQFLLIFAGHEICKFTVQILLNNGEEVINKEMVRILNLVQWSATKNSFWRQFNEVLCVQWPLFVFVAHVCVCSVVDH